MKVILSAGHKNTDGGGAYRESEWTYPACVDIRDELVRRGHEAWIIQEHDGDSRPDTSLGRGLQNVAYLCVELAKTVGGVDLYFSQHYEGTRQPAPQGAFGVYPDAQGDSAEINPLDIRIAKSIADAVAQTGMGWRGDGTMSEQNTYVGSKGYRLGEMVGTLGLRERTARVVFEAGNIAHAGNASLLWDPDWRHRIYPKAVVDGMEAVFGTVKGDTPVSTPDTVYAPPITIEAVSDDRPLIVLDNGAVLVRLDSAEATTIRKTPRMQAAHAGAKSVGPDIPAGHTFMVDYLIVNPDQSLYLLSPYWTRVRYQDCVLKG